jgi:thiol-disulfide isomerase/thioredoxin
VSPLRSGRSLLLALLALAALTPAAAEHEQARPPRFLPWPGGPAPPLVLRDLAGAAHDLAGYRGHVVVVNFWATWCEPCKDEMPSFRRLRARLAGRPVVVLAVNYGEAPARVEAFLRDVPVDGPVLLDAGQEAARAWRVRLLPASFVVGPDGRPRHGVLGELDWGSDAAVHAVASLLP